jgi:hypothetical protein
MGEGISVEREEEDDLRFRLLFFFSDIFLFFLEYAEELHIIVLKKKLTESRYTRRGHLDAHSSHRVDYTVRRL